MNPERYQQVKEVFLGACELERDRVAEFLETACAGDTVLREEVESLLAHHLPTTLIGDSTDDDGKEKIPRFVPEIISEAVETIDSAEQDNHGPGKDGKEIRFTPGTIIAGRYRIFGLLGRGGMGEVYRADDLKLEQPVALKFLFRKMAHDRSRLERFNTEVRLARKVTHTNVNRVYDIGEADGDTFISMEYVDGQNLGMLLQSVDRLTGDKTIQIARQLCAGLGAAHDRGVLHLDLKPANIMLDSRGQVCITDFGIATLISDDRKKGLLTGTPGFIAPELFEGKKPTVKADLYSLGVVLYESVTGRAPPLVVESNDKRRNALLSSLPDDIDAALARVILRCLEQDPRQRPDSAHEIAAALPGADPLDEIIAAGETPSPDMVAAAGLGADFCCKPAMACLSLAFLGLIGVVLLANRTLFLPQAGLSERPAVLAYKAQKVIADLLGHESAGHESAGLELAGREVAGREVAGRGSMQGFAIDRSYLRWVIESEHEGDRWEHLSSGRPPAVFFWYRQGDDRLIPPAPFGEATLRRKFPAEPGMNTVRLDCKGRLMRFEAMPDRAGYSAASGKTVDWSVPFTMAGLDIARFKQVDPTRKPPMFADRVLAWEGIYEENPSVSIRIEGASLGKQIVYFSVIPPYQNQTGLADGVSWVSAPPSQAFVVRFGLHMAAMFCGIFLAWQNFGRGRCDLRGAGRLALFVLVLGLLDWIVGERHSGVLAEEVASFYLGLARVTLASVGVWLWYIALEPHVRRWWPQTLITWSRVLQGHFRDPLLGRDILIGGLFGICLVLVLQFDTLLPAWLHLPQPAPKLPAVGYDLAELLSVRYKLGTVISMLLTSIIFGLVMLFLMSLFRGFLRNPILAAVAFCVLLTTVFSIDSGYDTFLPWLTNAVLAIGVVYILKRVGLVAVIVGHFVCTLIMSSPITSDFSAWYAESGNFTLMLVAGLLVWGFYLSLAGRPLIGPFFSKAMAIVAVFTTLFISPVSAADPLAVEKGFKQLFLDDAAVESREGLERVMHRPKKHGSVLRPDGKADGTRIQSGSAPVWVPKEKVYKMFYMGFPYAVGKGQWILGEIGPAMAVSKDGLHWERPDLGKVEWRGSKQNNRYYVLSPTLRWTANRFVEVIYTPHDPDPARRYKGFLGAMGRRPVVSADGINWKAVKTPQIASSDTSTLIWDELGKRYVGVVKSGTEYGRSASVTFSKDFVKWTKPRLTFCSDQQDQVIAKKRIAARLADPDMQNPMFNYREPKEPWSPGTSGKPGGPIDGEDFNQTGKGKNFNIPTWRVETYKMGVFPYEGLYMGVVMFYYPTGPAIPTWNNTCGFDEFQLVFTRDGQMHKENWRRLGNREPFLETSPLSKGLVGNFDRLQMGVFNRPLVMGDEIWFYYGGMKCRMPHYKMWPDGKIRNQARLTAEEKADFEDGCSAICLAKLRLDGFVSLDAGEKPGELVTRPFKADGEELFLNVDVRKGGCARVEVLDAESRSVYGFGMDSSIALTGNGVSQKVAWQGGAKWSKLKGKKVRLQISLREAGLYAFWSK